MEQLINVPPPFRGTQSESLAPGAFKMRENRMGIESNNGPCPGAGNRAQNSQICPHHAISGDSHNLKEKLPLGSRPRHVHPRHRRGSKDGSSKWTPSGPMYRLKSSAARSPHQVVNHICRCMLVLSMDVSSQMAPCFLTRRTNRPSYVCENPWPMCGKGAKPRTCIHVSYRRCSWL